MLFDSRAHLLIILGWVTNTGFIKKSFKDAVFFSSGA
jgi:hypothetical protein